MSETTFKDSINPSALRLAVPTDEGVQPRDPQPVSSTNLPPKSKRNLARTIVVGGVVIATVGLVVIGFYWGYYRFEHTVVRNASVKGRVYKVGARIDSQVRSVEVQPGQRVVRDQILVRLVDDHIQAAARQAQAELQAALKRGEVEKLGIEHERRRLALDVERCQSVSKALASEIKAAMSDRDKWQLERTRIASLLEAGVAPASELDNVTTQRDSAVARVEVSQANLAAAESSCRLAQVQLEGLKVREAGLEVLTAESELARQRLAVCEADIAATLIRAPGEGWVVDRIVEPGGSAKVGEPMMSLWLGAPWIEAWVDEKKLSRIKIGSPVDITLTAYPGRNLRGQVDSIGVLADKELQASPVPAALHAFFFDNAMIPVRIAVMEGQVRLQPGLSAIVGIRDADSLPAQNAAGRPESFLAAPVALADTPQSPAVSPLKPQGN